MTWGNNGAGPVGVPPVGPTPNAGQMIGTGGGEYPPLYLASFESVMAAVSRGEVSLNAQIAGGNQYGGINNATNMQGNPTLLQAISQSAVAQNATNGIGVVSGPGVGAGNGPGIAAVISGNGGAPAFPVAPAGVGPTTAMGGTQAIDAKQMMNASTVNLISPLQYGGA